MITWTKIENRLEPFLGESFPNYLILHEKFLKPLTGFPKNPSWRRDTHPYLEQIGMSNYGIAKSINFIHYRKSKISTSDDNQSFKNIYFHFGLTFDCLNSMCRCIIKIKQELELKDAKISLKISKQDLIQKFEDWVENKYENKYDEYINYGKPIFYYPQNELNFISLIFQNPLKREYNNFVTEIGKYRNYFIHNPGVDVFMHSGSLYTIKKEMVDESKNWSNIKYLFETNKNMFINPNEMVGNDLNKLLSIFNKVYQNLIDQITPIYDHENFHTLFKGYKR